MGNNMIVEHRYKFQKKRTLQIRNFFVQLTTIKVFKL